MNKNYKKVQLSSKWTKLGYYGTIASLFFTVPFAIFVIASLLSEVKMNMVLALIILLALLLFSYYAIKNLAIGEIRDNVIYLKKFSQPEKNFKLEQVEDIKIYENLKDIYVVLKMKKGAENESFLLACSKMFYTGEVINADIVLKEIKEYNKTKKQ